MALFRSTALVLLLGTAACATETPATAVVENAYAPSAKATVYRVWYATTLFEGPVAPGATSEPLRTVPGTDDAWVLVALDWEAGSGAPPARLVALKSAAPLTASRGEELRITVSDATFLGSCAAGRPLSQEDADVATTRIFPGAFAGGRYDAKSCAFVPDGDAGSR